MVNCSTAKTPCYRVEERRKYDESVDEKLSDEQACPYRSVTMLMVFCSMDLPPAQFGLRELTKGMKDPRGREFNKKTQADGEIS